MIQTILAFFGYTKIPKEAIQISILLENDFKDLILLFEGQSNPKFKQFAEHLKVREKALKTMTSFLRSGKLLHGMTY